jgi:hypothetical protein
VSRRPGGRQAAKTADPSHTVRLESTRSTGLMPPRGLSFIPSTWNFLDTRSANRIRVVAIVRPPAANTSPVSKTRQGRGVSRQIRRVRARSWLRPQYRRRERAQPLFVFQAPTGLALQSEQKCHPVKHRPTRCECYWLRDMNALYRVLTRFAFVPFFYLDCWDSTRAPYVRRTVL